MVQNKLKVVKIAEVDFIPPAKLGPINPTYDAVIKGAANATKDTISVQIEDTSAKQVYSGLHKRIQNYNLSPDRTYDLKLAQRNDITYIQRLQKDSLSKMETPKL
jgi:hypothetical protein